MSTLKFLVYICCAVNPMVAVSAQRNQVIHIKTQRWISSPSLDVMRVDIASTFARAFATLANISVTRIDNSNNFFPFARSVMPLALWRTAVHISGIAFSSSSTHSVSLAPKIRLGNRSLFAQDFTGLLAVFATLERISVAAFHVIIFPFEVFSSGASGNREVTQFFVNAFRVAPDKCTNFIGRKTFNFIFLAQPVGVKVRRLFSHNMSLTPSKAVVNANI